MSALSNKIQQIAEKEYPKAKVRIGMQPTNEVHRMKLISALNKVLTDRELLQEAMNELGEKETDFGEAKVIRKSQLKKLNNSPELDEVKKEIKEVLDSKKVKETEKNIYEMAIEALEACSKDYKCPISVYCNRSGQWRIITMGKTFKGKGFISVAREAAGYILHINKITPNNI